MQCDMVNSVRWLIDLEYSGPTIPEACSARLITGWFPILLVIQPMSGMVARRAHSMVMGLLSCESIIDNGSMSPLICIEV